MAKIKKIPLKIQKFLAAVFLAITLRFKIKESQPPQTKSDQPLEIVYRDDFSKATLNLEPQNECVYEYR